jgi:hypothetical protein
MHVLISSEGNHEPKGQHYMAVDAVGLLIDLAAVKGTLHDSVIARVTWGQLTNGRAMRDGGVIVRRDGSRQTFFEQVLLEPYLGAFKLRKAQIEAEQIAFKKARTGAEPSASR